MESVIFVFRRDLRLEDNHGLYNASLKGLPIIPCFIFDPRQIEENKYFSLRGLQFLVESLESLSGEIKSEGGILNFFYGKPHEVLRDIIKSHSVKQIHVTEDYTPFSRYRDSEIQTMCNEEGVPFYSHQSILLNPPGKVLKDDGSPYTVYTPFMKKTLKREDPTLLEKVKISYNRKKISLESEEAILNKVLPKRSLSPRIKGGRSYALKILENLKEFSGYDTERNIPSLDKTTKLSAYLKFGSISPREFYIKVRDTFNKDHTLIRELIWRDFFTHIAFFFPHVFKRSFNSKYDQIEWDTDIDKFNKWRDGITGFPIVDAGIRELNETGYMHNRVRMIVGSFLVKDLQISWRWGERYFAQQLVDYDPAVNNGNWQWVASTGCDAQPYFRIFNPWLQQKKFDADAIYIKRWVPELSKFSADEIHNHSENNILGYPPPMLKHEEAKKITEKMYSVIKNP